jgi:Rho termination factor, N-terminal domain
MQLQFDEAPRQEWKNLNPITKLNCGITAGKKIKALEQVFYLTPQSESKAAKINNSKVNVNNNLDTKIVNYTNMTTKQLKEEAKKRQLTGYSKLNKSQLIKLLS